MTALATLHSFMWRSSLMKIINVTKNASEELLVNDVNQNECSVLRF